KSLFSGVYGEAYDLYWKHVKDQQNAFFNMIDRALNGPSSDRDSRTLAMLDQWLQRPKRDPYVDLRSQIPACGSSPDEACSPVPLPHPPTTDFLFQPDPFLLPPR